MAKVKINFSKSSEEAPEQGTFIKLPEGMHRGVITLAELTKTKDQAKYMLKAKVKFPEYSDRELYLFNMINQGDNNTYLRSTLVAAGHPFNPDANGGVEVDTDLLIGKPVIANIYHKDETSEKDGKVYSNDKISVLYHPSSPKAAEVGMPSDGGAMDLSGGGHSGGEAPGAIDLSGLPF